VKAPADESAPQVAVEREAKLIAPEGFVLPRLDELVPDTTASVMPQRRLTATYYDTADLRLVRSGITLRYRTGEPGPPWTVKLPDGAPGPALVRREIRFTGPRGHVPDQAADLVLATTRGAPLVAVARISTLRAATQISAGDGRALAEVDDDTVTVSAGRHRRQAAFREVEIEVGPDAPNGERLLHNAVARLTDAGCVAQSPVPKLVHALGAPATEPPDVIVAPPREPVTVADVIHHAIARSAAQILRHDPGVRLGEDPEDVHQLRVGTRRLRSDLRTFARQLDAEQVAATRAELGWLAARVGVVRDADVLTARLRTSGDALPDADSAAVLTLLSSVGQQAGTARAAMLDAMRSSRYLCLLDALVTLAGHTPLAIETTPTAPAAAHVAACVAGRPWRRLARAVAVLPANPPDDALHRVRILAKRCRYSAEAVGPLVGPPAARFAAAVADVQTVLGDHQDTVVAEAWLREAARDNPAAGVAAGELIAHERTQRERLRAQWPVVWHSASAKKLRRWM
jgi:CHAD domain-containing protein